jgi:hypothetical protein
VLGVCPLPSTTVDPDVITFAAVCTTIVATIGCLVGIGVTARLLLMRAKRLAERPPANDDRLLHLEQSVDAIAIEIERISEAQRFQTKLLAERVASSE